MVKIGWPHEAKNTINARSRGAAHALGVRGSADPIRASAQHHHASAIYA
jgi:hypothetical protein